MNGKTYGNDGFMIVDSEDITCALDSISEIADYFISCPDDEKGATTATAAFYFIRDAVNELSEIIYEMIGNAKIKIKRPERIVEEAQQ